MKLHRPRTYLRIIRRKVFSEEPEPAVATRLRKIRGSVFLDIGACEGRYTRMLSKNFDRTIAFEPNEVFTESLRKSFERCTRIIVLGVAVSDKVGTATLYLDDTVPRCSGSADTILEEFRYHPPSHPEIDRIYRGDKGIRGIPTISIDFIRRIFLISFFDLIKIDVEGAEFLALDGARESFTKGLIGRIVVELHDLSRKEELEKKLKYWKFNVQWLDADHIFGEIF